jgi:hypothetical protein
MKKSDIDSVINNVLNEEFNKRSNLLFEKKVKKDIDEKLVGKQSKIDKNKNGKIDAEDFKLLKKGKKEVKEKLVGKQTKIDKNKNGKIDAEDFKLLKKGKKSVKMSEEKLISFIENIINEANDDKLTKKPATAAILDRSRNKSKSEENEYIVSVGKKMNDYLKVGSNGKYNTNPDQYPKTNGQLKKTDVKAYRMDDSEEEYVEELGRGPGMENLSYDEIHPNEETMKDYIEGSSKTGNNPKWANATETDVNARINKKRKNNYYSAEKKRAYDKSLDVNIVKNAKERPKFINKMEESENSKGDILMEEFEKMKKLINYNKKTQ